MDISHATAASTAAPSPLTRRRLVRAGLTGALLWAAKPYVNAAASLPSSIATTSEKLLLWTDLTLDLIKETKPSPPRAARALALVHVAMAEAVRTPESAPPVTVSGAAATVLGQLFPQATTRIASAEQAATRSHRQTGARAARAVQLSRAAGRTIGQQVMAWARADGSEATRDRIAERPTGTGIWQPTPPDFRQNPLEPLAGRWHPWVVPAGDALRPAPPPDWDSPLWAAELLAVQQAVARRTPAEEEAVHFWAGGPGTVTPAGIWIEIARDLILRDGLDTTVAAEVLALTSIAMADAFICCWDAKYAFWTARPITADPTLDVLIPTPPFPSYTSGHSTISAAAATVLGHFFPTDAAELQRQAAEAKDSRLWAGIHFPLDNDMGALGGSLVGRLVLAQAVESGAAWNRIHLPAAAPIWAGGYS